MEISTLVPDSNFYKRKLPDDEALRLIARFKDGQSRDDVVRFWANVLVREDDECWLWLGAAKRTAQGSYGRTSWKGKVASAHRVAYIIQKGEIPEKLLVRHTCDNRRCVNGKHLVVGTHKDNTADAKERGRLSHGDAHKATLRPSRGEQHYRAKLTWDAIVSVRAAAASGETYASISRRVLGNIGWKGSSYVGRIVRNEIWKEQR